MYNSYRNNFFGSEEKQLKIPLVWTLCFFLVFSTALFSQQVADESYDPFIKTPEYKKGKGPVVFIDQGHNNFHTKAGRYKPFANLLEKDGYQVKEYDGEFKSGKLTKGKILVISNALNERNLQSWVLPTPSAFTTTEINVLKEWVFEGGSLFLIADHMPMAGAAEDLAEVFGFSFSNGFVFHASTEGIAHFNRKDSSVSENIITNGRNENERVGQVVTFTGQGFKLPSDANAILTFDEKYTNLLPDTAWVFSANTPTQNVKGWSQGAFKKHGKGKVVVFGEAAMFTAQLSGPNRNKTGMNQEEANENYKLLLNIIHWLDGKF